MKKLLLISALIVLMVVPMTSEPWGGRVITLTGTAIRVVTIPTLASSISFQMATGGTHRGFVLFAPKGITCATGGAGTTLIAELAPASATGPGGNLTLPFPEDPQNPQADVSLYCADGTSTETMNVAWNVRN